MVAGLLNAALMTRDKGDRHHSRIQLLVDNILPGLPPIDPNLSSTARTSQAVESNVRWTVQQILNTPECQARLREGEMKIVGALFEIATGRVRFLFLTNKVGVHPGLHCRAALSAPHYELLRFERRMRF